jgi:multiple sugar transport system substrate-binding protein
VFRGARHPDAAWKLVEYLSRPEQQQRFYELTGSLPARTAAWEGTDLATGELTRAFWTQLQRVAPLPAVPEIEPILARLIEHSESAIRGGTSAERALADLDRDTDRMLEKRRWLLARNGVPGAAGESP